MPFDNDQFQVTQVRYDTDAATYSYATLILDGQGSHKGQLRVQWNFTHDRNNNALSAQNVTMDDRRSLFVLPTSYWTVDEDAQTITISTDMSLRTPYLCEDGITSISFPDVDLDVAGQSITIMRQTVSNEKVETYVTGSITPDRINSTNNQVIALLQEIISKLNNDVLLRDDLNAADGPIGGVGYTIPSSYLNIDLNALTDVYTPAPVNGYVLKWVSANNRWEAQPDLIGASASLPAGGVADMILVKQSGVDGDATWETLSSQPYNVSILGDITTLYSGVNNAVPKAGALMTGPLLLYGDPLSGTMAATKQYVDGLVSNADNILLNPMGFWDQRRYTGTLGGAQSIVGYANVTPTWYLDHWGLVWNNIAVTTGTRTLTMTKGTDADLTVSPTRSYVRCTASAGTVTTWDTTAIARVTQKIEGPRASGCYAKFGDATCPAQSLSGYVRSSQTGNLVVSVKVFTQGYTYTATYLTAVVISAANTWTAFSIALPAYVNATFDAAGTELDVGKTACEVSFILRAGATYNNATPNTWVLSNATNHKLLNNWPSAVITPTDFFTSGTTVDITNVQWTPTSARQVIAYKPTEDFDHLQRYYQKSYNYDQTPGVANTTIGAESVVIETSDADGSLYSNTQWHQTMCKIPAVQIFNPTNHAINSLSYASIGGFGSVSNEAVSAIGLISENGFGNFLTTLQSKGLWRWHWTAEASLV